MGKVTILEKLKRLIASIAWNLFIWGNDFTEEEYWQRIYEQEKAFLERALEENSHENSGLHKRVVTNSGELTECHAGKDGECNHPNCPQIRDGEPEKTGRSCPLWDIHKEIYV